MKRKNVLSSLLFISVFSLSLFSCSNENQVKDKYTFTYDYNYQGSKNRVISVGANKRATYYDATRVGYVLDGWFEEKECINEFYFETLINQDTTVYALWTDVKDVSYCNITFDYNYDDLKSVVKARVGKKFDSRKAAKPDRLGYKLTEWCLDKELTKPIDFENFIVEKDITLYAKYNRKDITFNNDQEVNFENVKIRVGMYDAFGYMNTTSFNDVLKSFNELYEGKISVEYVNKDGSAANLIFNQTELINMNYDEYYPMEDVLELANIDFRENNYNDKHINNCYIENKLWTMPVCSYVPCAIYNKRLMKYYNGDNPLPSSGDELISLIEKVNEGESYRDDWYYGLTMSADWDMREILSNNIYIQNGLELYTVNKDNSATNKWHENEETPNKVLSAIEQFRKTFILKEAVGRIKGRYSATNENKKVQFSKVGSGKSFMGLIGVPGFNTKFGDEIKVWNGPLYNNYVGVMPISGLFAVNKNEQSSQDIYVKNFSFAVPKMNSDIIKIAAAGVFANYFSANCSELGKSLLYPANRIAQHNMFNNAILPWQVEYILKNVGDSTKFVTYDGHFSEYNISNEINTDFLIEELFWLPQNASQELILEKINYFANSINREGM